MIVLALLGPSWEQPQDWTWDLPMLGKVMRVLDAVVAMEFLAGPLAVHRGKHCDWSQLGAIEAL